MDVTVRRALPPLEQPVASILVASMALLLKHPVIETRIAIPFISRIESCVSEVTSFPTRKIEKGHSYLSRVV